MEGIAFFPDISFAEGNVTVSDPGPNRLAALSRYDSRCCQPEPSVSGPLPFHVTV